MVIALTVLREERVDAFSGDPAAFAVELYHSQPIGVHQSIDRRAGNTQLFHDFVYAI
jgi:hypothetical protein